MIGIDPAKLTLVHQIIGVTAITVNGAATAGGTAVAITGTNFTEVSAVNFGATAATYTVNSATSISATSPAGSAGTVDVTELGNITMPDDPTSQS